MATPERIERQGMPITTEQGKKLQGQPIVSEGLIKPDIGTQVNELLDPTQDTLAVTPAEIAAAGYDPDHWVAVGKTNYAMHPGAVSHNPRRDVESVGGVFPTVNGEPRWQNLDLIYGLVPRVVVEAKEKRAAQEAEEYLNPIPDSFTLNDEGALRDKMRATQEKLYAEGMLGPNSPTYKRSFEDEWNRNRTELLRDMERERRGGAHQDIREQQRELAAAAQAQQQGRETRGDRRNAPRSQHAMGAGFDANGRIVR